MNTSDGLVRCFFELTVKKQCVLNRFYSFNFMNLVKYSTEIQKNKHEMCLFYGEFICYAAFG